MSTLPTWIPQVFVSAEHFYIVCEALSNTPPQNSSPEERICRATLRFAAAFFLLPAFAMLGCAYHLGLAGITAVLDPRETKKADCVRHLAIGVYNLALSLLPRMVVGVFYAAFPLECRDLGKKTAQFDLEKNPWLKRILS